MTGAGGTLEIEVKFDILDRRAARALINADEVGGHPALGPARRVRQLDRYLDSADARLRKAGWIARLRTVDGVTRLQLKLVTSADQAGVLRRTELDGPADIKTDPSAWPTSAARRRLLQLSAGQLLGEAFTLRQDRLARDFGGPTGRVELSLDRIEVVAAGPQVSRLSVLELEHLDGDIGAFGQISRHLGTLAFLAPSFTTKLGWAASQRMRISSDDGLPVISSDDLPLRAEEFTTEAGRHLLRAQLRRLVERERAFKLGAGPEEVRKLRVATRRLRATWRAFGDTYEGPTPEILRRGLRRLARVLGVVRDLDVLLARMDAWTASLPIPDGEHAFEGFRAVVVGRRAAALDALARDLTGKRHVGWVAAFDDFVENPMRGVVPIAPPAPRLLGEQLGGWIWSGFERLRAWEPLVDSADVPTLHELRIEAKGLRDLVQVIAPVSSIPTATIVASLVRVQDLIGGLTDAAVVAAATRAYLRDEAATLDATEALGLGRFALAQEREVARRRRRVPTVWGAAVGEPARHRMGRLIGSL